MPTTSPEILLEILEDFLSRQIGWGSLCGEDNGRIKRTFLIPFAAVLVDLDITILNEVHHTEKDKWDRTSLIHEI